MDKEVVVIEVKCNSLYELMERFNDKESCVKHLEKLRWSKGIVFPCCGGSIKSFGALLKKWDIGLSHHFALRHLHR